MKIHLPLSIKKTKKQVCMGCKTEVQYFDCNNRNRSSEKQYTENKGISTTYKSSFYHCIWHSTSLRSVGNYLTNALSGTEQGADA